MSIRNGITLLIATCILCLAFNYMKGQVNQIRVYEQKKESLIHEVDSLNHEIFHHQLNIGRYEMALELLKEQNPKAYQEFQTILNTQTE